MESEAEEFAALHGLSLEEAEIILTRRARSSATLHQSTERLRLALDALERAQKKVGVHPVVAQGGEVVKTFDEEAEANLEKYYAPKGGQERPCRKVRQPVVAVEDVSQDPEDY